MISHDLQLVLAVAISMLLAFLYGLNIKAMSEKPMKTQDELFWNYICEAMRLSRACGVSIIILTQGTQYTTLGYHCQNAIDSTAAPKESQSDEN